MAFTKFHFRNFTRGDNSKKYVSAIFSLGNPHVTFQYDITLRNSIVVTFQGPKFSKRAITKKKYVFFSQCFIILSIYHPLSADTRFKFLALTLFEIRHLKISCLCFSKGRYFKRGDN